MDSTAVDISGHNDGLTGRATMMPTAPQIVFAIGFIGFFTIRKIYGRHWQKRTKTDVRVDWIEQVLLAAVSYGMFVVPFIYLFTAWLDFADLAAPQWLALPGGLLMAISLLLFWRTHVDLGRNWSPSLEIGDDQTLITQGIYRRVRHPMYSSFFLFSFAQILLLHNWIAGFSTFVTFLPLYIIRLPREERMMIDRFGEDYVAYMKTTGHLLPVNTYASVSESAFSKASSSVDFPTDGKPTGITDETNR